VIVSGLGRNDRAGLKEAGGRPLAASNSAMPMSNIRAKSASLAIEHKIAGVFRHIAKISVSFILPSLVTSEGCMKVVLRPRLVRIVRSAHAHIERALATMGDVGVFETDHELPEFRQAEPLRHLPSQHAGFAAAAFAGDNQN
jgi:hypothetical protein